MKIWVDDIREPPNTSWVWKKTSSEAIEELEKLMWYTKNGRTDRRPEYMSLDHDLGGDDTTRPIVLWMCENEFWPKEVVVHSANPTGIDWLVGMVGRYHPNNAHKYTDR